MQRLGWRGAARARPALWLLLLQPPCALRRPVPPRSRSPRRAGHPGRLSSRRPSSLPPPQACSQTGLAPPPAPAPAWCTETCRRGRCARPARAQTLRMRPRNARGRRASMKAAPASRCAPRPAPLRYRRTAGTGGSNRRRATGRRGNRPPPERPRAPARAPSPPPPPPETRRDSAQGCCARVAGGCRGWGGGWGDTVVGDERRIRQ